jgi:hypothetical protein
MRWAILLVVIGGWSCATVPRQGGGVAVYQAALDAPAARRSMPEGCRLVKTSKQVSMTELDMEGQRDPFHAQRKDAAAAGANALLVLRKQVISRRDTECPGASRITDCPPSFGAWFDVVFESYACTPDALKQLSIATSGRSTEASRRPPHRTS